MSRRFLTLGLFLSFLLAERATAEDSTPYLVKDINTTLFPVGSEIGALSAIGPLTVFRATDDSGGSELWRTDGTLSGTFRLVDACPGTCSGSPTLLASSPRGLFFAAAEAAGNRNGLWVTDGTIANTRKLAGGLVTLRGLSWSEQLRTFFLAIDDGVHGEEVWRSDGTPAGTKMVVDLKRGPEGSNLKGLVAFGGGAFFIAGDRSAGWSLWRTTGTAAGTKMWKALGPGSIEPPYNSMAVVGRRFVFLAGDGLWAGDGTRPRTRPLALTGFSVNPFPTVVDNAFRVVGKHAFAVVSRNGADRILLSTDGTDGGTELLELGPNGYVEPLLASKLLTQSGDHAVLVVTDPVHGSELWVTDGTAPGTHLLIDFCPGLCEGARWILPDGSGPGFVFTGDDGSGRGRETWHVDSFDSTPRRVFDLCRDNCPAAPQFLARVGSNVVFQGTTAQGTVRVMSLRPTGTVVALGPKDLRYASPLLVTANVMLFGGYEPVHGSELWITDGTAVGTKLLRDIRKQAPIGSQPTDLTAVNEDVYFVADDNQGTHLWKSDGTALGTERAAELPIEHNLCGSAALGGALLFRGRSDSKWGLWRTDGTSRGTAALRSDTPGCSGLVPAGDFTFFIDSRGGSGDAALWRTDGSPLGTVALPPVGTTSGTVFFQGLTEFRDRLFFTSSEYFNALLSSDGTPGGTRPAVETGLAVPYILAANDTQLFFLRWKDRTELWVSDGTPLGTAVLDDLGDPALTVKYALATRDRLFLVPFSQARLWTSEGRPHTLKAIPGVAPVGPFVAVGEIVYFAGKSIVDDGELDPVLWRSDGSDAGTFVVRDDAGNPIRNPNAPTEVYGRLFVFGHDSNKTGFLWSVSEAAGAKRVVDSGYYGGAGMVRAGSTLFFTRSTPETGGELWAIRVQQ